ncbi:MAG: prolyl oligopeptidase family serine peptidase [Salegentibacter sp.]|uniref:Phospholipase/Carboxylesterase n=1 Tax=Salegentibacter flavus TaxID=287099 RepID=A0A1I4YVL9_9FLAO|nr:MULTISPECIES: prolyl oligopeptidase family serine peptidase [Salegentibacter]MDR9456892.1 prolyl oligopeptidase family serine peptidase [Salegentibacter sp.]SFN42007.1 Phospholipase/Carboxylesterase [Salegentibacter flavus]
MKYNIPHKISFLLVNFFLLSLTVESQNINKYDSEVFVVEGDSLNYRILFPKDFSEEKEYPVVLFLHGAGERGGNNESQLTHGSELFLKNQEEFPAIVIFPQAPKDGYWARVEVKRDSLPYQFDFGFEKSATKSLELVMKLMDKMQAEVFIDESRIYVGGLSMGGMGTFEMIYRKPEMFAAAFAICGGANPKVAEYYRPGFNIWIFHGEKDNVVPVEYSKKMARMINHFGGNAKLSLYPEANHNSWDTAFAEPFLLPWLFSHSKN